MCGIFAYQGAEGAPQKVLEGLKKLDYRGYDSWGVATVLSSDISVEKAVGAVTRLQKLKDGAVAIGHTRWATHGAVTEVNAHPHLSSDGMFALAHNGIVENAEELKEQLQKRGHSFKTQTDTEVIVRMIENEYRTKKGLAEALRGAFKKLTGRNTIILLTRDGRIMAAKNGSPLIVGKRKGSSEIYFSSDVLSFSDSVDAILVLQDGDMVEWNGNALTVRTVATGKLRRARFERNTIHGSKSDKGSYEHFMEKEIHESPDVIREAVKTDKKKLDALAAAIKRSKHVYCIGSGTAGVAAAQTAYYLRVYGGIHATALIGAEASDYYSLFGKGDLLLAPSQSGETADVLEVLQLAKRKGAKIASHVNMPGSAMTRLSDFPFMANAGPEICVMSTKIFVSQIAWGYLLSQTVGGTYTRAKKDLSKLVSTMDSFLKDNRTHATIRDIAKEYAQKEHLFLLGKGQNVNIIKEGMVKIIEGSYVHAHGIPAGDLKHYAITLVEDGTPVIALISNDALQNDVKNAVHEVQARGAHVLAISAHEEPLAERTLMVPDAGTVSAIMNIIPLQLLAYHMAVARGNNVDKPRNIAKSVTVK